jgi:peptidoglycan/LPS O-acetylase OafA/YrhL
MHGQSHPITTAPGGARAGSIPGLDGLRAISILLVMISHAGLQNLVPGVFGVTVFFCISGYLITRLLLDEFDRTGAIAIGPFYARRMLRLSPPLVVYVAVMAAVWSATGHAADPLGVAGALFYFANYLAIFAPHRLDGIGGHLWSLAVEEHFYAAYPLLLLGLLIRGRGVVAVLLAICAASLASRFAVSMLAPGVAVDYTGMATECRIEGILAGAIAALATRGAAGAMLARRLGSPRAALAALAALLTTFLIRDPLFRQTVRYTIQEMALIPIILAVVGAPAGSWLARIMNSAPMTLTGKLSYSLYLWHLAAYDVALWLAPGAGARLVGAYALGIGLAFLTAAASYWLVEQPFFGLRRRFGSHVRPAEPVGDLAMRADQPARSA